jgi:tetratricopeptide (TPR) repeat protein
MSSFKMSRNVARCVAAAALLLCFCLAAHGTEPIEWVTDLVQAKQAAAKTGKDLLINFTGLAWCEYCEKLEREVLATDEFTPIAANFVLVRLDYPSGADRLPQELRAPHVSWQASYGVKSFPTVFLADATGRPYAVTGYIDMGPKEYLKHLSELRKIHAQRDAGFAAAAALKGVERAKSLAGALKVLESGFTDGKKSYETSNTEPLVRFYRDEVDTVIRLDADNSAGLRAHFNDILHSEERRVETEVFENVLRKTYKEQGIDETLRLLNRRIADTDSPLLRNRFRRSRLDFLETSKRYEAALAYARELAADESYSMDDQREVRTRVAYNLQRLGRGDEALAVLDKLIAEVRDNPRQAFLYLQGKAEYFLRPAGRYTEALETLDVAIKLVKPDTVDWRDAQSYRARLLKKLGRFGDACAVYKALVASRITPSIDRAYCLAEMAEMLDKRGSRAAALDAAAQAQQILKDEPKSTDTENVTQVQSQINKVTGAMPAEPSDKKTPGKANP